MHPSEQRSFDVKRLLNLPWRCNSKATNRAAPALFRGCSRHCQDAVCRARMRASNATPEGAHLSDGPTIPSPASLISRTLGHYRIAEKIGAGGMGVVYRAHDERLERDVALKVLPPGTLADDSARKRFRKEALALSRLNHPNIATVHDFDTHEGIDFLVTELVPGLTLDERIMGGPLPEKEVIQIGVQMTDGLQAAHHEGVIHRDLKPGNLRLTPDKRLKILDFGIAKRVGPGDEGTLTQSVSEPVGAVGTLAYMAPEQLKGEKVDARSDLWAAGVVLYELATGRHPFEGKTTAGLAIEILHAPAPSPQALQPKLSLRLADVILKCLEKDPENRYQSAKELLVDLRRLAMPTVTPTAAVAATRRRVPARTVAAGVVVVAILVVAATYLYFGRKKAGVAVTPQITSLAVLPLANLSGDASQEYFADGMTESLITELSHIGALKVISRTSVMQYKGVKKPLPEIARQLNVDAVIEGSVMREGDQVKITVQLIHAPSDTHLWAQDYVREMRGILSLQSEVARAIAGQVKAALTPAETARFASSKKVNPEAYDLYLRGKAERSAGHWRRAVELFQQATEKDPNYASAFGALGASLIGAHNMGELPRNEAFPRAQQAVQRAIELDPEDLDALKAQVTVTFTILRDYQAAERIMRRILERAPNDGETHNWLGQILSLYGRFDESVAEARRAVELDPQSVQANTSLAGILFFARRYDEGISQARRALELGPDSFLAYFVLMNCYDAKGMYNEGAIAQQRFWVTSGGDPGAAALLVTAQAQGGYRGRMRFALARLLKLAKTSNSFFGDIAWCYAVLGDKDQAFRYLERAYQEYDSWIFSIQSPAFDSLRDDPRWLAFLRRLNLQDTPMAKLPAAPALAAR